MQMRTYVSLTMILLPLLAGCPDNGGNGLTSSTSKAWGTAQLIETDNVGNAGDPQVAVDGSGNAMAVWHQWDGTRNNIWATRYVAATQSWGTVELLETDNGDASGPQVAIDSSGNAVAAWVQSDGTRNNIWANRYVVGTGWGTAQLLETDNGDASIPRVASNAVGNVVAVWYQDDGTRFNIWATRYVAGTGWGTAQLIETDNLGDAAGPQVALDGNGNAVAVWAQYDGTRNNIWANRYVAITNSWGTAQVIETDNGEANAPHMAIDGSRNAVVTWRQADGLRDNVWSNRYVAATNSWGTPELIETDDGAGPEEGADVAVDGNGNAVAVWQQENSTRLDNWANHYR